MDYQEFIKQLETHLQEIKKLYKKANPSGAYLTLTLVNDTWQVNNEYWEQDANFPINYAE